MADEKSRKWAIKRSTNGISLNGDEYLSENGKVKLYDSSEIARLDLMFHGYDESDMNREGIEIVEVQDCGDHYEPIKG